VEIINRNYIHITDHVQRLGFDELISSAFAEAEVYTSSRFVSRGGLRVEYNTLINRLSLDPRFSLAYKTGASGQISLAYGRFRQTPKNEYLRTGPDLQSEKAQHFILNYQRIENNRTFRIESYYKRYTDLVKFRDGNENFPTNLGYGFAQGIEVFWRDNQSLKNVDYWISYSFLNTKRNYLNFPLEATPFFASRHNLSVVYKHFIPYLKSQLGFTYSYASGRPYNNPNNQRFNSAITPSYQDLSFNWSYLPDPSLIIYFSCTNLLSRDNIFGHEYSNELNGQGAYNGRAIRQAATHFLFVGIFITLSKEKSVNQLPNL
jgi:outer membrane cobalamin receptor